MASSKTFEDLKVWQSAHALVLEIYKLTQSFPDHEQFGLIAQIRRAAISIPANIAEGFAKTGAKDKARFYNIAQGSLEECKYYLILANDLKYGKNPKINDLLTETAKLLSAYRRAMLAKS